MQTACRGCTRDRLFSLEGTQLSAQIFPEGLGPNLIIDHFVIHIQTKYKRLARGYMISNLYIEGVEHHPKSRYSCSKLFVKANMQKMNASIDSVASSLALVLLRQKAEMTARRCEQLGQQITLERVNLVRRRIDHLLAIHAAAPRLGGTSEISLTKSNQKSLD